MDIEGISDFIALAECRSFSRAAEARAVTQSAFSRRIQALEHSIGTPLIDRSVTPVALTKAGERFLIYARNLTDTLDKAIDDVTSQISVMNDPAYMVMPHSISVSWFPHWYRDLQRKIPDLNITVSMNSNSRCIQDLRNRQADLAIIMTADNVSPCFDFEGLEICEIGKDKLMAVKAAIAQKNHRDFLAYPNESYMKSCSQKALEQAGASELRIVFESSSSELLKGMAMAGFGTAVLQESIVEDELKEGFLIPAFSNKPLECKILLVRMAGKLSSSAEAIWQISQR